MTRFCEATGATILLKDRWVAGFNLSQEYESSWALESYGTYPCYQLGLGGKTWGNNKKSSRVDAMWIGFHMFYPRVIQHMENHHVYWFYWIDQLFQWPFSLASCYRWPHRVPAPFLSSSAMRNILWRGPVICFVWVPVWRFPFKFRPNYPSGNLA